MKTRRITKWSFVIISTFTLSFYVENISAAYMQEGSTEMASKNAIRLQHARELLGTSYNGSLAERSASLPSVSKFVYSTVQNKLSDKKWAKHVANVSAMILSESEKKGFDPLFVLAVIQTESQFDPTIIGGAGEIGLMQIKPDTAKWIAQKENIPWKGKNTLKNPTINVRIGIAYMAFLRKNFANEAPNYVSAYNMGPRNVRRLVAQAIQPKEYSSRVMGNYEIIYAQMMKLETLAQL
ncbi:lytic transglycosylase domain-containing protein [Bdellovibrio sp. HCB337]|uniref:lytic transglycosylase domain-containing protein n=1 Tax=Bdellovibrio sp. HCB337 TaxID=3394358 RepID=UPI0039A6025D